jgi:metal-dependent hydrolase (beta-lactamase superfamily II)
MEIHLLDVGTREYGDCIIVHNAQKRILVDGAHKGDSALLKKQMKEIFNQESPYHFDLLVLTPLHDDHIG